MAGKGQPHRTATDGAPHNTWETREQMPELPEVEVVTRGLSPVMRGRTIASVDVRRPDLRMPFTPGFAGKLRGATILKLERRAKYILAHLTSGEVLVIHLGMTGRLTVAASNGCAAETLGSYIYGTGSDPKHDHVVLELCDGSIVTYNDPRRFGLMLLVPASELANHALFRGLGVEPLGQDLDAGYLARAARGRKTDLKAFLLDQRIIAGLGNIYVSEALFRAGLSPRRRASTLSDRKGQPSARTEQLVAEIKAVLNDAIAAGGSTLRDYRHTDGSSGSFQESFAVYDRAGQPCVRPGCNGIVRRIVQANRSSFCCTHCQT